MSRVEDDRDAARLAARLAEAKRTEEAQKNKKAAEGNAFSKLVQGQKKDAQLRQEQAVAKSTLAQLLEAAEAGSAEEAKHLSEHGAEHMQQESAFKSKLGTQGREQRLQQNTRTTGEQGQQVKEQSQQGTAQTASSRQADQSGTARGAEGRKADAKVSSDKLDERKEASDSSASAQGGVGGASKEKGDIKTDADKGGGQQGGGKDKDNAPAANPSFRFNPALMAPVSVAKTKEASGSERLRKVANELAQKIVERVRIGTNAAGKMEFQVDLKSDVLAGLSLKVSAHNGKIRAVFQGSDKDVLKMIEEQGEALKAALGTRGLTLEDLKIEAR